MFNVLKILTHNKCTHNKISAEMPSGYCPDCGEYIENHWYLVRCSHCKIKRHAHLLGENVIPDTRFCPNCGGFLYEIEKLEKINFIDINFAILKKEIVKNVKNFAVTTTWVENDTTSTNHPVQKLLGAQ